MDEKEEKNFENADVIYFKKGRAEIDEYKANYKSATKTFYYTLALGKAHAIILHPSFCCPLVIEPSQPVVLYLLINEELMDNYSFSTQKEGAPKRASRLYTERINLQLKYSRWENRLKFGNRFKHPDNGTFFFEYAEENPRPHMISTEPVLVDAGKDLILLDEKGYISGHVNSEILKLYAEDDFKHMIRLTISNHKLTEGLYNIHWTSIDTDPEEKKRNNPITPAYVPQDRLLEKAFEAYRTKIKTTFKIPSDGADTCSFELNHNEPIESFHPVLVTNKEKLGFGHLTDVHISSRQQVFKKSTLQVIPGASKTVSPPLGELVHAAFDSLKDLMDQMGKDPDVDMLFFTGDLVDFSLNLDPSTAKVNCSQDIWKLMMLQDNHDSKELSKTNCNTINPTTQLEQTHTPGIDDTIIYSLFKYFYDTYKKPIFLTSGNHDSYGLPFGISPRVGPLKANEGIPMDHNLTFYEAILLFGKGYSDIVKYKNFNPKHAYWFYHVFTPMKDFSFQYKEQVFTGLEWGHTEAILTNINEGTYGGTLPRADTMLNKNQLKILKDSTKRSGGKGLNILFTHATIVNYAATVPLDKIGQVFFNSDGRCGFSKHDHGSFHGNRKTFYTDYIVNKGLTHTFSGHSHRSALYTCEAVDSIAKTPAEPNSIYAPDKEAELFEFMKTSARSLTNRKNHYNVDSLPDDSKTKIIVTGSGGPLPTKNITGELEGLGLGTPTGTIVTFKGGKERISALHAKNKTAKPRFAVALDACEIIGGHPVVTECYFIFLKTPFFCIKFNKKLFPSPSIIKSVSLHFVDPRLGKYVEYPISLKPNSYVTSVMEDASQNIKTLAKKLNDITIKNPCAIGFMSIHFSDTFSNDDLFCQYDFDSPLVICVQTQLTDLSDCGDGITKCSIERTGKISEIPNFKLYKKKNLNVS